MTSFRGQRSRIRAIVSQESLRSICERIQWALSKNPRLSFGTNSMTFSKRGMPWVKIPRANHRGCISASNFELQLNDFGPAVVRLCHSRLP